MPHPPIAGPETSLQSRVLESMVEGVHVVDEHGVILFSNPTDDAMFGYPPGGLIGQNVATLMDLPEIEASKRVRALLREVAAVGRWSGEIGNRKRDGTSFITHVQISSVEFEGRQCFVSVREDITVTKRLEAQLLRAQRLECVGRLASGIAHDLNNILAPIMMGLPMLRSSESAKQRETLLATMETCVDRGSHLVRQLLYFGRGIEGQRGPLRLRDTVHEIAEIVSATFPRTITIETDVAKDVWPVRADGTQIHQVLLNLCVNARDAMPQGGRLTIVVANETPESALGALRPSMAGSRVRIVVSDTGTGIPAEHLARIWDPFFSTKDPGKGTGLGLSTVLGIVQAHGGTIDVQSESGRGTQFRIHLPAEPVSPTTAKRTATSGPPSGNGETILLVEDEAAIRELTQIILQLHGYNVISAENGADGIAKFHQHANQVRLVLTDFDMPELNGLSFIKKLQQFAPEMKIIMASGIRSGLDSDGCLAELSALGVTTLLTKPCSPETILHAVHDMLHAPGSKCNSSAG